MGRPTRAALASTRIITFRLTAAEAQRLNELAEEQGHKDRSSLLRAWIAQSGPIPQTAHDAPSSPALAKTPITSANPQRPIDEATTVQLNPGDDRPKQIAPSEKFNVLDLVNSMHIAIQRERDSLSGWSRIPEVVRALLPRFGLKHVHIIMNLYARSGQLELSPNNHEPLSREDEALCPSDATGIRLLYVRWMGKENSH